VIPISKESQALERRERFANEIRSFLKYYKGKLRLEGGGFDPVIVDRFATLFTDYDETIATNLIEIYGARRRRKENREKERVCVSQR